MTDPERTNRSDEMYAVILPDGDWLREGNGRPRIYRYRNSANNDAERYGGRAVSVQIVERSEE